MKVVKKDKKKGYKAEALVCRDVPADGSCFFSAIGELISFSNGDGEQSSHVRRDTNKKLRKMIANEILENKEKYQEMIRKSEGQTPEQYAKIIVHPSMWGGYIDAVILSDLLQVTIIILALEPAHGYYFTMSIGNHDNAIAIRFKRNHYNYLLRENGSVYLRSEDVIAYGDEWQHAVEERRKRPERPALNLQLQSPADQPPKYPGDQPPPRYSDLSPEKMRTPMLWECPKRQSSKRIELETVSGGKGSAGKHKATQPTGGKHKATQAVAAFVAGGAKPQSGVAGNCFAANLNAIHDAELDFDQHELEEREPVIAEPAVLNSDLVGLVLNADINAEINAELQHAVNEQQGA